MKNFASSFINSLAISLLIILVALGVIFLTFNSPDFLKRILKSQGTYSQANTILASTLFSSNQSLSEDQMLRIINAAFTKEELEQITNDIIDNFYLWLKSKDQDFKINIKLSDKKDKFRSEANRVLEEYVSGLPECTDAQIDNLLNNPSIQLDCRPSPKLGVSLDTEGMAEELVGGLPDSINAPVPDGMKTIPKIYRQIYIGLIAMLCLVIILFGLAFLLSKNNRRSFLRLLGIGLVINGIPFLLIAYFSIPYFKKELAQVFSNFNDIPLASRDLLENIFTQIYTQLNNNFYTAGIILTIIGLVIFTSSFYLYNREK